MAAVAAPALAEAQIVYSGVLNTALSASGTVTLAFQGTPTPGSDLVLGAIRPKKGSASPMGVYVSSYGHTAVDRTAAALGDTVDSSGTFTTLTTNFPGVADTSYYYGFSYADQGETLYGWFQYTLIGVNPNESMVLNDWAYNSVAGQAITIGQTEATVAVPEPSAFAALLGVAVLGTAWGWRRRRRISATP